MNRNNPIGLRIPVGSDQGVNSLQSGGSRSPMSGWSSAQSGTLSSSQRGSQGVSGAYGFATDPNGVVSAAGALGAELPAEALARLSLPALLVSAEGSPVLHSVPRKKIIHHHAVDSNGNIEGLTGLHPGAIGSVTATDQRLGAGSSGRVDLVRFRPVGQAEEVNLALKTIYSDGRVPEKDLDRFLKEVRMLAILSGQAAPALYDYSIQTDGLKLLMGIPEGVTLSKYPAESSFKSPDKSIRSKSIHHFAQSILESLQVIHSKDICHRDIKPNNLFVKDNENGSFQVTFIDLGLATSSSPENYQVEGTNKYAGLLGEVITPIHADLHAVGVILRELAGETVIPADSFERDDATGTAVVRSKISSGFERFTQQLKQGEFESAEHALSALTTVEPDLH